MSGPLSEGVLFQDARINPDMFAQRLQEELKSTPQPILAPLLKVRGSSHDAIWASECAKQSSSYSELVHTSRFFSPNKQIQKQARFTKHWTTKSVCWMSDCHAVYSQGEPFFATKPTSFVRKLVRSFLTLPSRKRKRNLPLLSGHCFGKLYFRLRILVLIVLRFDGKNFRWVKVRSYSCG